VVDRKLPKYFVTWTPESIYVPDVVIEPRNSKIVEIICERIQASKNMSSGYSLRFPRVKKIRGDKSWFQCIDTVELQKLIECSEAAERKSASELMKANFQSKKKRKSANTNLEGSPPEKKRGRFDVVAHLQCPDISRIKVECDLFAGKELFVYNGARGYSKGEIEVLVARNGGCIVQNPGLDTDYLLAGKISIRVQNFIDTARESTNPLESKDIISTDWLLRCLNDCVLTPPATYDLLFVGKATEENIRVSHDIYGDSFTNHATVESLRRSMLNVMVNDNADEMDTSEEEFDFSNHLFFRGVRVLLIGGKRARLCAMHIQLYGGLISKHDDTDVTHIIISDKFKGKPKLIIPFINANHVSYSGT
jgi:hypothetical protein